MLRSSFILSQYAEKGNLSDIIYVKKRINGENRMADKNVKRRQKNMVNYQMQYERQRIKIWLCIPLAQAWFFALVIRAWKWIPILLAVTAAVILIIRWLCGSMFSIRHSHVGRELMKYGDLRSMVKEVNEQARNAWYCTVDQALTEKYLMLVEQNEACHSGSHMIAAEKKFYLISTGELERVEVEADSQYSDEMNTLVFRTLSGRRYTMTVYKSYEEVCAMKRKLEGYLELGRGPVLKKTYEQESASDKKRERVLYPGKKRTVQGYISGAKKLYFGVLLAVILVVAGMLGWIFQLENYTFAMVLRDIKNFPGECALLAAVYIVPFLFFYYMIRKMEKQIKKSYQQLNYHEQQELELLVAESPELKTGDVLYAGKCFWFRDFRNFWMHSLILYDEVIWIYPAYGAFRTNIRGVDMAEVRISKIVFYTRDGKKHSILMGDWKSFSAMLPHAILGYGREQKRVYRDFRKSIKLRNS